MKTLANCDPIDFLRQTNKIRHAVSGLLADSGVMEIRKRTPVFTGNETPEEQKEKINAQAKKNIDAMLDALMEKDAEQTAVVLGMMCFMEPEEVRQAKGIDFLAPAMELLTSKPVLDFLASYAKLGRTSTDD